MKKSAFTLAAGLALLAGISLGVTSCTQAPAPVAAAPADTSAPAPAPPVVVEERRPVVVEENRERPKVDIDVHKRDDGDHTSVDIHARP
jgi:hypothetical protein